MKKLFKYREVAYIGLMLYILFSGSGTDGAADYVQSIGPKLQQRETGTQFVIVYNDTARLTVTKLKSGAVTFGNTGTYTFSGPITSGLIQSTGISTFDAIWVNSSVGVSEDFYVEGTSLMTGYLKTSDAVRFQEMSSTPSPAPAANTECNLYMKSDKLIAAFDDGIGTIRYKYLILSGTDTSWHYSASAP